MARTMVNRNLYTLAFPTREDGHECPLPSEVLTQTLLQHIDQCMRHEDVVIENHAGAVSMHIGKVALELIRYLMTKWSCGTGTWQTKTSGHDLQSRCTVKNVSHIGRKNDKKLASVPVRGKMRWATATRSILKCKMRIERLGDRV